jgi:cell division protein FtsQ
MKKAATLSVWLVIFTGLILLIGFIGKEHQNITCTGLEVRIDYKDSDPLVDEKMILKSVRSSFDSIVGKKISELNLVEIEKLVQQNEFLEYAEVFYSLTGQLKIKVIQKQPLLRVINAHNHNYYIDVSGDAMPVRQGFSSRVLVVSGYIPYVYSDTLNLIKNENFPILKDLYQLALHIKNDPFLNPLIEQIYVNQEKEFELVPKIGKHIIQFGDISDMETKFWKLIVFYQNGMGKAGWSAYNTINLKFRDQVVCAKK